jgi:DNA-directed RNA polymerase subunit D
LKVKVIEKTKEMIKFEVDELTPALAGELRHIMVSEVPTMSVEVVDFFKNESFLWNEILAGRIGLVPLTYDEKYHRMKEKCTCKGEGCPKCSVHLVLKKKGPGTVYSGDMKSADDKVKPLYDEIPLTELQEGQEIEFEAIAELGVGKDHAKWQGAIVGFGESKGKYTFVVESASGLPVSSIIKKSIQILGSKLDDFSSDMGKLK